MSRTRGGRRSCGAGERVSGTRADTPTTPTFFSPDALVDGGMVTLGEEAAHHMRVRRLEVNDAVALRDGCGAVSDGRVTRLAKSHAVVQLGAVGHVERGADVHLLAPVADRERMLWLAEKATELGVASWRPTIWRRSHSVGPRGEGAGFQGKIRARMIAALMQSEAAWLPTLHPDASLERALLALPDGTTRLVLDVDGVPIDRVEVGGSVSLAVGPEGGVERTELAALDAAGFTRVRLPGHILRFETAAVVGVAFARAALHRSHGSPAPPSTRSSDSDPSRSTA